MATDVGRSPDGSGYSAEPEPSCTVSALRASIPNAMVERVARGLFLAEHPNAKWSGGRARSIWWLRAYAALEAMREPTDAMLASACEKHLPGRPMHDTTPPWPDESHRTKAECPHFKARRRIWRSMIDAALAWPTSDDVAIAMEAASAGETEGLDGNRDSAGLKGIAQPQSDEGMQ